MIGSAGSVGTAARRRPVAGIHTVMITVGTHVAGGVAAAGRTIADAVVGAHGA